MKTIKVTEKNIAQLAAYQGTNKVPEIGSDLYEIESKIPCVQAIKGKAKTFSILTDLKPSKATLKHLKGDFVPSEPSYYNCNRWSLNSKFLKI